MIFNTLHKGKQTIRSIIKNNEDTDFIIMITN